MKFRTKLLLAGKTATGIQVPEEVVEKLGSGKRPPVSVTINGHTYRSTIAVMGGKFLVGVSAEHREKAKAAAGDMLDVELTLDTKPRVVTVPPDFARALAKQKTAKKVFDSLSYSKKNGYMQSIQGAKTDETRQRRIEKTIGELSKL